MTDQPRPVTATATATALRSLRGWRRPKALGAVIAGAGALALLPFASAASAAGTANPPANVNYSGATATGAPTANNTIVGSGGSATYPLMQALDTLFNQVPGCVITSGSVVGAPSKASQQLNYSCETNQITTSSSFGDALEQQPGPAYLDNPINDVAYEEPPFGSGNGIAQLELGRNQVNTGIGTSFTTTNQQNVSAVNYARSSSDPSNTTNVTGLNYVAYAKDAIVPLLFTEFSGTKTAWGKSLSTAGLSTLDLQDIYNGTYYDWGQLGMKLSAPIFVYSAQEGSGAQSTFDKFLGFDPSAQINKVNCTDPIKPGTKVTSSTFTNAVVNASTCQGPDVIFANETASILANASSTTEDSIASNWQSANGASPVGNSIYYYPYGTFTEQCEGLKEQVSYLDKSKVTLSNSKAGADCGSTPLPTGSEADKLALTPVNGTAANPATILGTGGTVFPIDRYLYNVYSNGDNPNLPEATAATLNYVSEVGFLCKTQTVNGQPEATPPTTPYTQDTNSNDIIDPLTGLWYHDEIFNTIVASGFIPITATVGDNFGSITDGPAVTENGADALHLAYGLLSADNGPGGSEYGAAYLGADAPGQSSNTSISSADNPYGYCLVSSTDSAKNS